MKKKFICWSMLLLAVLFIPVLTSCGSDDEVEDEPAGTELASYIIGNWHVYKYTMFLAGILNMEPVTKTNDNSDLYMECKFESGGKAVFHSWDTDENGTRKWREEKVRYSIDGNTVKLTDSDGDKAEMIFDPDSRELYLEMVYTENGITMSYRLNLVKK